jgi:ParB-like chromosome segregation protein Spo0J
VLQDGERVVFDEAPTKPNGAYRIYDGRHRFLAYVLAERDEIPATIAEVDESLVVARTSTDRIQERGRL